MLDYLGNGGIRWMSMSATTVNPSRGLVILARPYQRRAPALLVGRGLLDLYHITNRDAPDNLRHRRICSAQQPSLQRPGSLTALARLAGRCAVYYLYETVSSAGWMNRKIIQQLRILAGRVGAWLSPCEHR